MNHNVCSVILAGGKGTRLAPLTQDTPKPMINVLGKPVIEYVFDRLCKTSVTKAYVTTMYLPWQIEAIGRRYKNLDITYVREQNPLGTAGAVKNAIADSPAADAYIILSGDGLFDFDLQKAIDFHFEKNADVTIVSYKTENPLSYGVILYDSEGKISRFAEKPPWSQVVSGTVNTGIYIVNKDIIDIIPKDTEFDFANQLFPLLLAEKRALFAYESQGTWHDIGNLDEYFAANRSCLDGVISGVQNDGYTQKELSEKGVDADSPLYVSKNAIIGKNVKIGAYSVIESGAVISDGCDISCSVIGEHTSCGMGCGIYGAIIGKKVKIGENCVISEGCAIGGNAEINDCVILPKYSFINSAAHIDTKDFLSRKAVSKDKNLFGNSGIDCDGKKKSPEFLMRVGYSCAEALKAIKKAGSSRIGVMCDDNPQSDGIVSAILCGIRSAGIRSYNFGHGFDSMARFASLSFITDVVIFVHRKPNGDYNIKMFDEFGLPVSDKYERETERVFFGSDELSVPEKFYATDKFDNLWTLYYSELVKSCRARCKDSALFGFSCAFSHTEEISAFSPVYTAICAISELGGRVMKSAENAKFVFDIENDGGSAKASSEGYTADDFHINALLIDRFMDDSDSCLYIPYTAPDAYKTVAERRKILYSEYAQSTMRERSLSLSREQMYRQLWLCDGVFKILNLAIILHESHSSLKGLTSALPDFEIYSEDFDGGTDRASIMQNLAKMSANSESLDDFADKNAEREGIRLVMANGSIKVIPGKIKGFKIISEARSIEAAKELCEKAEGFLK